jgi:hypothetical protein
MMAEMHREEAGRGAETGTESDEGKARGQPNRCAVKGGEAERGHRRVREGEKEGSSSDTWTVYKFFLFFASQTLRNIKQNIIYKKKIPAM